MVQVLVVILAILLPSLVAIRRGSWQSGKRGDVWRFQRYQRFANGYCWCLCGIVIVLGYPLRDMQWQGRVIG